MTTANITSQELDGIIAKVKKLLALSQSTNEHEAALAAARAQDLLFKHNLDMAMLGDESGKAAYETQRVELGKGKLIEWKRDLIFTLARYNFCRAVSWTGSPYMSIVGQRHNFEVVMGLNEYLVATLTRLVERAFISYRMAGGSDNATSYKTSWLLGAVSGIGAQLREQQRTNTAAGPDAKALVVTNTAELDEAMANAFGKLTNHKGAGSTSHAGYSSGYETGKALPIHAQVKDGKHTGKAIA